MHVPTKPIHQGIDTDGDINNAEGEVGGGEVASMMTKMATPVCQASVCTLNGSECAIQRALVEKNPM